MISTLPELEEGARTSLPKVKVGKNKSAVAPAGSDVDITLEEEALPAKKVTKNRQESRKETYQEKSGDAEEVKVGGKFHG